MQPAPSLDTILRNRLENALATVAQLVIEDPVYIPVFERVEQELAALDAQSETIFRAREIAIRSK